MDSLVHQNAIADRPVDFESSIFYLRKAIALKPELGGEPQNTIGYANFCLATVTGLLGVELLDGNNNTAIQADGKALIGDAIEALQRAEKSAPPALQYHLKAYLLFFLDDFDAAAIAWRGCPQMAAPITQNVL